MSKSRTLPVLAALAASFLITAGATPARAGASKALQCAFAKQRAAVRLADALLACDRAALLAPGPIDPACTEAAFEKAELAFQKIEMKGGCTLTGDVGSVEQLTSSFSDQLYLQLQGGVCLESGAECGGGSPPCCSGLICSGRIGHPPTCG